MKNTNKFIAFIVALLMLVSATAASAATYVSDAVSPNISASSSGDAQLGSEATPEPEATLAPEASAEPTPAAEEIEAVVTTENENGSVNIRAAASSDSEIVGKLTSGMSVTVLGTEGDWTRIRADGIVGYVFSKYLKVSAPEEQAADPTAAEQTQSEIDLSGMKVEIFSSLDDRVAPGETILLTSKLTGFEGIDYSLQWQRNDGNGWKDVEGATEGKYEFEATLENIQYTWRLAVTI